MSDSQKVKLIRKLIADGWECVPDANDAGFWKGVLMAIEVVLEE